MKKLLLNLLVIIFALSLTFCGDSTETTEETSDTTTQVETDSVDIEESTEETTSEAEEEEEVLTGEVMSPDEIKEGAVLNPADLAASVNNNKDAWKDEMVTIKGTITSRTVVTSNGKKSLQITVSENKDSQGGAFCVIDLAEGEEEPAVKNGDEVTVSGKVDGMFFKKSARLREAKLVE